MVCGKLGFQVGLKSYVQVHVQVKVFVYHNNNSHKYNCHNDIEGHIWGKAIVSNITQILNGVSLFTVYQINNINIKTQQKTPDEIQC